MTTHNLAMKNRMTAGYAAQPPQRGDTARIADKILIQALKACAQDLALGGTEIVTEQLRQGKDPACTHMCCVLARQVAQALGALDERVRAIYTPNGSRFHKTLSSVPAIDLTIWREQKTTAFDSLVADLDTALSQAYRDTVGTQDSSSLLDVHVIEDSDLEKHFGSGKRRRSSARLPSYLLRAHNELAEIVYAQ
jgi:hypothetical protein